MDSLIRFLKQVWFFWLIAILILAGYILLFLWFPLRPYYNIAPQPDIYSLAPSLVDAARYAGLIIGLYGLYLIAYKIQRSRKKSMPIWILLGMATVYALPLLFSYPMNATDVYRYFVRGRISAVHSADPFSVPVSSLQDEPYAILAGEWAGETSPYGPLWELTASSVTSLAPDNLWLSLLMFKGLAIFAFLIAGWLIWLILANRSESERASLTLLWAWNPTLLLTFAMNGHNDGLMIIWLLLGWLLMKRERIELGMIALLLAPLIKPVGLLALPYFFVYGWHRLNMPMSKLRYLVLTVLVGLLLIWLSFLPFGSPIDLVQRLLNEASSGGGFSPLALVILELRSRNIDPTIRLSTRIGTILFACLALWLLIKSWRGRSPLLATADIFAGYIIQAFRFRIWYAVWPFPWLLIDQDSEKGSSSASKSRLVAGVTFLLSSQLSVLIYSHLRIELFGHSQLRAHRLGVLFTFGLPLVAALVAAVYNARSRGPHREK